MSRLAERVVAFYNKRGTCEQWIKEGKGAIKWTRLSCRTFAANAVRLQIHAPAYNTLATPDPIKDLSLTSLTEKLIKIGAKVVSHGRYVIFQMAEVAIPRHFQEILWLIAELRPKPPPAPARDDRWSWVQEHLTEGLRPDAEENRQFGPKNAASGPDRMRAAVNRDPIYRRHGKSLSSASSRVHPGNCSDASIRNKIPKIRSSTVH
jgi:hypothetical protein